MAGKTKGKPQRAGLAFPGGSSGPGIRYDAGVRPADSVPSSVRQWWHRVLRGIRRRHEPMHQRSARATGSAKVSDTAHAVFELYRASGCTRVLPRTDAVEEFPPGIRTKMQRTARKIFRAAKKAVGVRRRHHSSAHKES